ncbi:MAG: NAD-glutamate dehydrogenase domain-containing protein, partial [Acidimicrobiales bacterium]
GVFPRTAKIITLSDEVRTALDTDVDSATPDELISIILRAPVDLLWNGGIGTYIKAADEPHQDVGDKANDAIRVDARDLRCRVIGEGGNLGVTQRGRIEFADQRGRVYTDAIDNAAGVDCSDHEVNIKILLDRVVADGDMTHKQRNELLVDMTSEVALLVLSNNYSQTQALSTAVVGAASLVDVHARYLTTLESDGLLDRQLEHLPDTDGLAERRLAGRGLTAPELAVVLAYTKNNLQSDLLESSVPDDEAFLPLLQDYFPTPLRRQFGDRIARHRLRREIVANRVANLVVDRGGTSMTYRLTQETSAPSHEIAAAHMVAWEIFQLDDLAKTVNALDNVMAADEQMAIHLAARQLAERATRLLVRTRPYPFSAADAIADLAEPIQETIAHLPEFFVGADHVAFESRVDELVAAGTPADLASRTAALGPAVAALDIVAISTKGSLPLADVAAMHFAIADALELNWLRDRILALPRDNQWSSLARLTLRGDLYADHRELTAHVASLPDDDNDPLDRVERWLGLHAAPVAYFRGTVAEIRSLATTDLTTLLIASREVRNLISRTGSAPAG